ncbi:hypothetical protein AKO1_002357 [Acrasis kona]|uniref:Uncharacterized protein n=1 Tax=Acrasis kona TaxID=1008807 RepID=A0AAW2YU63_9EUKA
MDDDDQNELDVYNDTPEDDSFESVGDDDQDAEEGEEGEEGEDREEGGEDERDGESQKKEQSAEGGDDVMGDDEQVDQDDDGSVAKVDTSGRLPYYERIYEQDKLLVKSDQIKSQQRLNSLRNKSATGEYIGDAELYRLNKEFEPTNADYMNAEARRKQVGLYKHHLDKVQFVRPKDKYRYDKEKIEARINREYDETDPSLLAGVLKEAKTLERILEDQEFE